MVLGNQKWKYFKSQQIIYFAIFLIKNFLQAEKNKKSLKYEEYTTETGEQKIVINNDL